MGEVRIGVGDRAVTRKNDSSLGVANRQAWRVATIGPDGSVALDAGGRWARLPASYVAEALDLAYATTGYGNQGVTAERLATWVGPATTAAGLYVGATRGRWQNTLHVVARGREAARDELLAALGRERSDRILMPRRRHHTMVRLPALPLIGPNRNRLFRDKRCTGRPTALGCR